ncbi:hypothetical protein [Enterococcus timonensis]|uniref:hypothetical protein n=1 Tax=Enterococcus timonensis TaxID=1852364 RepID=UPI00131A121A|nr:hypothetical protein [Enterococcus timonensis]
MDNNSQLLMHVTDIIAEPRLLMFDQVTFTGLYNGLTDYTTLNGSDITIPEIKVEKLSIVNNVN